MLTDLYLQLSKSIQANPVLAGAFSLYGLGIVTWAFRSVPAKVWGVIKAQATTSVSFNNASWENKDMFLTFLEWYSKNSLSKYSRKLSLDATRHDDETNAIRLVLGPGYGHHLFIFKKKLYWFTKEEAPSSGSQNIKERVSISTFGRNHLYISDLIEHFTPKFDNDNKLGLYTFSTVDKEWQRSKSLNKRPLESVIVKESSLEIIRKSLDGFYERRDWYLKTGIAHKQSILLHGIPGTGKTSLVKALASHYDASIYTVNLKKLTDATIEEAIASVAPGSFLLLEDFDSSNAVTSREISMGDVMGLAPLSLSSVLNALDGVAGLDNVVIFMTTNHIENIDSAMLRAGRTDLTIELGKLEDVEIRRYINYAYENVVLPDTILKPMAGCDLHSLLLMNKENSQGFVQGLIDFQKKE